MREDLGGGKVICRVFVFFLVLFASDLESGDA